MKAVRCAARCGPSSSARGFATHPSSTSRPRNTPSTPRPAARDKPAAPSPRAPPTGTIRQSILAPVPKAEDMLMSKFSENAEPQIDIPLVSSREDFGKKYLYEIITMPIRSPDANMREMVDSFNDEEERSFFVSRPMDIKNIHVYIQLLGETKRIDRLRAFFRELKASDHKISLHMYTSAISACALARRVKDAEELEKELIDSGLKPDNHVTVAMVSVLAKAQQYERALKRIKDMNFLLNPQMKEDVKLAYTSVISSYVENELYDKAWETFNYMKTYVAQPDVITYCTMIKACAMTGQAERALGFYQEIRQRNLQPTESVFNALIHACARRLEFLEEAFLLFESMKSVGFVADRNTYSSLLLAAANGGNLDRMKALVRQMEEEEIAIQPAMHATMIKGYTVSMKRQAPSEVTRLLAEAQKVFDKALPKYPQEKRLVFFSTMLLAYCTAMRAKKALAFFEEMSTVHGLTPNEHAYQAIITMWVRFHKFDVAQQWLEKMLTAGFAPEKQLYLVFIDHAARRGLINLSLSYLRAIVTKLGVKPRKDEVRSLWEVGKEDLGVRRELELCLEPTHYIRPQNRPPSDDDGRRTLRSFLPRHARLPPPRREQPKPRIPAPEQAQQ